jgi:hypothetical protein
MPADQFDMHHPDVAVPGRTTQAAYDAVWFDLGWRKRLPKTSSSTGEDSNTTPSEED